MSKNDFYIFFTKDLADRRTDGLSATLNAVS